MNRVNSDAEEIQLRRLKAQISKWILVEAIFALSVTLLAGQVRRQSEIRLAVANDKDQEPRRYFAFLLQLLCGSLYPSMIFNYTINKHMLGMSLVKVENLINAQKFLNAFLIVILLALGFTRYHSMDLMNSIVYGGIFSSWTIIVIYAYLVYYAIAAIFFVLVMILLAIMWCFNIFRLRPVELENMVTWTDQQRGSEVLLRIQTN